MASGTNHISHLTDTKFLYQHSPCGHLSFDLEGKIHSVNETFLQWTGLSRSACLSGTFTDLLSAGGVLYYQMVVSSLLHLHGLANEINFTFKSSNGKFDALFNAVAHKSETGQVLLINAAVLKITDRKKYETELLLARREAEEDKRKMEFLLNALPVMIWTALPDGRINYVNKRTEDYFGHLQQEELDGFKGIVEEDRAAFVESWAHCMQFGEILDKEVRVKKADDTYEWVVFKAEPYKNKEGEIETWFCSCTSIHTKKILELANQSVLIHHLTTAHQTIEQNKDQFSKIAFNQAHMIRKPLANMMGLIPLLQSEVLSAEGKLLLELLDMSAADLDYLIKDIVAHTKL